jgi:hypothetical protein
MSFDMPWEEAGFINMPFKVYRFFHRSGRGRNYTPAKTSQLLEKGSLSNSDSTQVPVIHTPKCDPANMTKLPQTPLRMFSSPVQISKLNYHVSPSSKSKSKVMDLLCLDFARTKELHELERASPQIMDTVFMSI